MIQYKESIFRINNVHYDVGGKKILKGVTADVLDIVGHGQVVAIVGPSGIGKTTLFDLLSGKIQPSSGSIEVFIEGSGYIPPKEGIMGVVAQNYPLFSHLKVIDNLLLVSKKDLAMEKLSHFGMEEHANKYPCQLSGGQKQRIAIIQQILCSERFILMDEPFSGLDCIAKCEVCRLIKEVAERHEYNTVIVITHSISDAIRVADTVWLLGRDRDAAGNIVPGAYIKESINIAAMGMAWQCCSTPRLADVAADITTKFKLL